MTQPGRDERPLPEGWGQPAHPFRDSRRGRTYVAVMGVDVVLIVVAWFVLRGGTAAIVLSLVAAVLPPLAANLANAGGPIDRRQRDAERRRLSGARDPESREPS